MSRRCRVSAFFSSAEAVDDAVYRLSLLGVPRDLIEVAVSREVAARYYPKRARPPQSQAVRLAAIGALIGLLVGIAVSVLTVILPGWELPRATVLAQLLGPNAGSAVGALVGAGIGALRKPISDFAHHRALEHDGILVVVRGCTVEDAPSVRETFEDRGAVHVRVDS